MSGQINPRVRALLVCPSCRGEFEDVEQGLRCPAEQTVYPVVDGVPQLVPERMRVDRPQTPRDDPKRGQTERLGPA